MGQELEIGGLDVDLELRLGEHLRERGQGLADLHVDAPAVGRQHALQALEHEQRVLGEVQDGAVQGQQLDQVLAVVEQSAHDLRERRGAVLHVAHQVLQVPGRHLADLEVGVAAEAVEGVDEGSLAQVADQHGQQVDARLLTAQGLRIEQLLEDVEGQFLVLLGVHAAEDGQDGLGRHLRGALLVGLAQRDEQRQQAALVGLAADEAGEVAQVPDEYLEHLLLVVDELCVSAGVPFRKGTSSSRVRSGPSAWAIVFSCVTALMRFLISSLLSSSRSVTGSACLESARFIIFLILLRTSKSALILRASVIWSDPPAAHWPPCRPTSRARTQRGCSGAAGDYLSLTFGRFHNICLCHI